MTLAEVARAVREALQGPCAVPEGTPILVACSGGADSVALAFAVGACRPEWPLAGVAFVDHGLRDVSAERGAARATAEALGVPFSDLAVTVDPARNPQAAARAARYDALEAATPAGAVLATGHTATDQAETVLQRLVRGAGLRGLAGIRARDGRRVRPLLAVGREVTRGLGLSFADDPSNATGRYLRNRLRHEVLPLLEAENPRAALALADAARAAAEELALVDALVAHLALADVDLSGADPRLVEAVVRWRHRAEVGGAPLLHPSAAELARRLASGAPDTRVSLGGGLRGRARRGRLAFEPEDDPRSRLVAPAPGSYHWGRVQLTVELAPAGRASAEPAPGSHDRAFVAHHPPDGPPSGTSLARPEAPERDDAGQLPFVELLVDPDRVSWPLVLARRPRTRDFEPGRAAGENVSARGAVGAIPGNDKMHRLVLVDGAGRAIWPDSREQPAVVTAAPHRGVRTLRIRLSHAP